MSILVNAFLGVPLLLAGLMKRRRQAIVAGMTLCAFAAIEIGALAVLLARHSSLPEVGLHAVVLVPVAIVIAIRGARALR